MFFGQKKRVEGQVMTEETCSSCGAAAARPFEEGDTVFGPGRQCAKCASTDTLITAVYTTAPAEKQKS